MEYRTAKKTDIPQIEALLASVGLHNEDVSDTIDDCVVAVGDGKIIGTAALECKGEYALLKSFAVNPECQNKQIGRALLHRILPVAYRNRISRVFLLTVTAEGYFPRFNFKPCERIDVPASIAETREFRQQCPASAKCMSLDLNQIMHYYPADSLGLKKESDGIMLWGVSLKNTQFTYFEVEPNREFKMHRHESEQITYVLEGELYFKTETETVCVKQGEAIALPSNLPHGAFTGEKALKAVDAWSPINRKYD